MEWRSLEKGSALCACVYNKGLKLTRAGAGHACFSDIVFLPRRHVRRRQTFWQPIWASSHFPELTELRISKRLDHSSIFQRLAYDVESEREFATEGQTCPQQRNFVFFFQEGHRANTDGVNNALHNRHHQLLALFHRFFTNFKNTAF